jgi:hypothetical protein
MNSFPYRDAVRDELVAVVSRHGPRRRRKRILVMGAAAGCAAAAAILVLLVFNGGPFRGSAGHDWRAGRPQLNNINIRRAISLAQPVVPERQIPLNQAQQDAGFRLLIPNTALANRGNMTVYEDGGDRGGITLRFPAPDQSGDVRQPGLSLWEAPWTEGDPLQAYKDDLANDPDPNKSICSVGNLPALCVQSNSPNDATQDNPAFVRVVIDKIVVELSGGSSVQDLLGIAGSLAPNTDQ